MLKHSYVNRLRVQFYFHARQAHFRKTRFEIEALGNAEMTYWLNSVKRQVFKQRRSLF